MDKSNHVNVQARTSARHDTDSSRGTGFTNGHHYYFRQGILVLRLYPRSAGYWYSLLTTHPLHTQLVT